MTDYSDQREFSRSSILVRSELRLDSGVLVEGQARDLSLEGISIETDQSVPVGNPVKMTLLLDAGQGPLRIETAGEVVRVSEKGVAIRFTKIDAESLEHLRRLVMFNADDVDRVEQEFDAHIGIRKIEE